MACNTDSSPSGRDWRAEIEALLREGAAHGLRCAAGAADGLERYCRLVEAWAGPADLVSLKDLPNLVTTHLAASLGLLWAEAPRSKEAWVDVGTGGGLPGMVVKICRPEIEIDLVDSVEKKVIFLERAAHELRLSGLRVLHGRVEELAVREEIGPYAVISIRAVASLAKSLPLIDRIAAPGTRLLTFKGTRWEQEIEEAQPLLARLDWELLDVLRIPWARPRILRLGKKTT